MPSVVYKLGGSLLSLAGLADRVRQILSRQQNQRPIFIVGGGAAADVVRDWARIHRLSEDAAHWLALRAMSLNEHLLRELLPDSEIVPDRAAAEAVWWAGRIPILSARQFLEAHEAHDPSPLPHMWDATSDSIAAWIARRWPADELVLLKSVPLPAGCRLETAAEKGLVDSCFPQAAAGLRISWCNLRANDPVVPVC